MQAAGEGRGGNRKNTESGPIRLHRRKSAPHPPTRACHATQSSLMLENPRSPGVTLLRLKLEGCGLTELLNPGPKRVNLFNSGTVGLYRPEKVNGYLLSYEAQNKQTHQPSASGMGTVAGLVGALPSRDCVGVEEAGALRLLVGFSVLGIRAQDFSLILRFRV